MLSDGIIQVLNEVSNVIQNPEIKLKLNTNVIDPITSHILKLLTPYIIQIFLLFFIIIAMLVYIIMVIHKFN